MRAAQQRTQFLQQQREVSRPARSGRRTARRAVAEDNRAKIAVHGCHMRAPGGPYPVGVVGFLGVAGF